MEKKSYESPEFGFQEMRLLERVADVCWGKSHHAWYDQDGDGTMDAGEQEFYIQGNSCNDARLNLEAQLNAAGLPFDSKKDTKENVNSSLIIPIVS
ncbi:hypothetical protein [Frisingicoccus sp.]|uniref:hypothetical protein n=1 Tax=Frisingicoccus sp. TaxID=1918627 RepID=UPI0015BA0AD6